jgi:hypothetical protein
MQRQAGTQPDRLTESSDARTLAKTSRARWCGSRRARSQPQSSLRPGAATAGRGWETGPDDFGWPASRSCDLAGFDFGRQPSIDKAQVREIVSGGSSPMARQCCSSGPGAGKRRSWCCSPRGRLWRSCSSWMKPGYLPFEPDAAQRLRSSIAGGRSPANRQRAARGSRPPCRNSSPCAGAERRTKHEPWETLEKAARA